LDVTNVNSAPSIPWLQEVLTVGFFVGAVSVIAVVAEAVDLLDVVPKLPPPMQHNNRLLPAINVVRRGISLPAAPPTTVVLASLVVPVAPGNLASVHAPHPQLAGMPPLPKRGNLVPLLVPAATLAHPHATPWYAWLAQSVLNRL